MRCKQDLLLQLIATALSFAQEMPTNIVELETASICTWLALRPYHPHQRPAQRQLAPLLEPEQHPFQPRRPLHHPFLLVALLLLDCRVVGLIMDAMSMVQTDAFSKINNLTILLATLTRSASRHVQLQVIPLPEPSTVSNASVEMLSTMVVHLLLNKPTVTAHVPETPKKIAVQVAECLYTPLEHPRPSKLPVLRLLGCQQAGSMQDVFKTTLFPTRTSTLRVTKKRLSTPCPGWYRITTTILSLVASNSAQHMATTPLDWNMVPNASVVISKTLLSLQSPTPPPIPMMHSSSPTLLPHKSLQIHNATFCVQERNNICAEPVICSAITYTMEPL